MTDYTQYPVDLLPLPQLAGHGYTRRSGTTRIKMASGRTRNRRQWFSAPSSSRLVFRMSSEEAQLFESWVLEVLEGGAVTFIIPFKTPAGLIDHTCKFTSDYEAKCLAPSVWEYAVDVEIEKLELLDGDIAKSVIDMGADLGYLAEFAASVEENINEN